MSSADGQLQIGYMREALRRCTSSISSFCPKRQGDVALPTTLPGAPLALSHNFFICDEHVGSMVKTIAQQNEAWRSAD
jgi:hypothetical protein